MLELDDYRRAVMLKPAQAIAYLKGKEPKLVMTSAEFAELAAEVRNAAFTISGVAKLDMLQDTLDALQQSIDNGETFSTFKKQLSERMGAKGWAAFTDGTAITASRLKLIYTQNTLNAYQAGRITAQKRSIKTRPYWQFNAIIDGNTTQGCSQLDGKVFAADDTFWLNNYPPRHMRCRSGVTTLSNAELKAEGLDVSSGSDYADVQAAPGFDGQPDQLYKPDLKGYNKTLAKDFTKAKKK